MFDLKSFQNIIVADFEYTGHDNSNNPIPVCLSAKDILTGTSFELFQDDLFVLKEPPFNIFQNSLFISYAAQAELKCFKILNWKMPFNVCDLYSEFRLFINPGEKKTKYNLIAALRHFGLPYMDVIEKEEMINLILRGSPWTENEKKQILEYCKNDVIGAERLFYAMNSKIYDTNYCLIRGNFLKSVACQEFRGIPIDKELTEKIQKNRIFLRNSLIDDFNKKQPFFEDYVFKKSRFETWAAEWEKNNKIKWPRTPGKAYARDKELLRSMAQVYPEIADLRNILSDHTTFKSFSLTVSKDNRSRCSSMPFGTVTGRNAPSTSKFIFGNGWTRGLIKPAIGKGLAYPDFSQQEIAIAAYTSNDKKMISDYEAGDFYASMGISLGIIPQGGTKKSHPKERSSCKTLSLAILYGMSARGMAPLLKSSIEEAEITLDKLKRVYQIYFNWSEENYKRALRDGCLITPFGWRISITGVKRGTLINFPMQACAGDIMRITCILLEKAEINLLTTYHDSFLIENDIEKLDKTTETTLELMAMASEVVLGVRIRADVEQKVIYPNSYIPPDDKGGITWKRIKTLLENVT